MTDWNKWDKFVADLSDDEDDTLPAEVPQVELPKPGVGGPLSSEGKLQDNGYKPGNARGNALSTNADYKTQLDVERYSWEDDSDQNQVTVKVPLAQCGPVVQEAVNCRFTSESFQLNIATIAKKKYTLHVTKLPHGGICPDRSSFVVDCAGGKSQESQNAVTIKLAKTNKDVIWSSLGHVERQKVRPSVTIHDYAWTNLKNGVKVWVKIPGVHEVPDQVKVRFRELSFDVTVEDLNGKDYMFAATELPMEVVVDECKYEVLENEVKIYLKKWAKTEWFKLTNLGGR